MGIQTCWYDDQKTIILSTYEGIWSWEDYYRTVDEIIHMLHLVEHRVDVIVDYERSAGNPPGNMIPHVRNAADRLNQIPNFGCFGMVGINPFLRVMSNVFYRMRGKTRGTMFMAKNIDEALAIIAQRRQPEPTIR